MMYAIAKKRELSPGVVLMEVQAPLVAAKAQAGQFIILRLHEEGERIPLTIADFNRDAGTVTIVFLTVGKSTTHLAAMREGEAIADFVGPLGHPTHIDDYGTAVVVGGGLGIAPIYPIAREMKKRGNQVLAIIGARTKDLLFYVEPMREASHRLIICSDDGSVGEKGFVTQMLKHQLDEGLKPGLVMAVGPVVMMKAVCEMTRPLGLKTMVSLNPIMVDGTGMCGVCRVSVGGVRRFACVDGPDFDGHLVDFEELTQRQRSYLEEEKRSLELYRSGCGGNCGRR